MPKINTNNMIFVFGSNLAGRHGAGAARYAAQYKGAKFGVGIGRTGQSYAIPTKDAQIRKTLSLTTIRAFVDDFIQYAKDNPQLQFQVTCIGCGLAGLGHEDIAPMFDDAPIENCWFDNLWYPYLHPSTKFWGTF